MGAQPSRASCLPGTKTDRRNLCEPRRYERRLPISEYHDLTLSRFSRYVASRGPGRSGTVGAQPSPALFAQSGSPVPARFGDTKPDRSPLFCRYLTVWPGSLVGLARISREISAGTALAAQAGYRARRLDQLRPARTLWPSSLAVPGMWKWSQVGLGDRFPFCSISIVATMMLSLGLTGLCRGLETSTRSSRHLQLETSLSRREKERETTLTDRKSSTQPRPLDATSYFSCCSNACQDDLLRARYVSRHCTIYSLHLEDISSWCWL